MTYQFIYPVVLLGGLMYIRLPTVAVHPYFGKASLRRTNHLSAKAIFRAFVYIPVPRQSGRRLCIRLSGGV